MNKSNLKQLACRVGEIAEEGGRRGGGEGGLRGCARRRVHKLWRRFCPGHQSAISTQPHLRSLKMALAFASKACTELESPMWRHLSLCERAAEMWQQTLTQPAPLLTVNDSGRSWMQTQRVTFLSISRCPSSCAEIEAAKTLLAGHSKPGRDPRPRFGMKKAADSLFVCPFHGCSVEILLSGSPAERAVTKHNYQRLCTTAGSARWPQSWQTMEAQILQKGVFVG